MLIFVIAVAAQRTNPGPDLNHRINIIQSTAEILAVLLDQLLGLYAFLRGDLRACRPAHLLAIPFGFPDSFPGPFMQVADLFFRLLEGFLDLLFSQQLDDLISGFDVDVSDLNLYKHGVHF